MTSKQLNWLKDTKVAKATKFEINFLKNVNFVIKTENIC